MADGPGTGDIQPISAGLSAQPLVPTIQPAVTGDAVDRLVNAFRNGALNTQDVIDRVGAVGQAKNKALLEQLQEYVSPEAIQSRMAQIHSERAKADLTSQLAGAQSSLIPGQTQLSQTQNLVAQAQATRGAGYQTFLERSPWYGESINDFKNSDGTLDINSAADRGNQMRADEAVWNPWLMRLTPSGERTVKDEHGNEYTQKVNALGQNVTPPDPESDYPGSPLYWAYAKQLSSALPKYHPARGQFMLTSPGGNGNASLGVPSNKGTQVPENVSAVSTGDITPSDNAAPAPTIQPKDVTDASLDWFRQQDALKAAGAAPAPPTIQPTSINPDLGTPGAAAPTTMRGIPTKPGMTISDAYKLLEGKKNVDAWQQAQATYQKFAESAKEPSPNSVSDLNLAENFSKILDPQSTLREFKFEALKDAIPWLSYLSKDGVDIIKREKRFPDDVRQKIIEDGFKNIDAADRAVAPDFAALEQQRPGVLNSRERGAAQGIPFRQQMGITLPERPAAPAANVPARPSGIPAAASWQPNIRGGVWATPDGRYWKP